MVWRLEGEGMWWGFEGDGVWCDCEGVGGRVCGMKIVWLDVCKGEGMCVAVTVRMVLECVVCL